MRGNLPKLQMAGSKEGTRWCFCWLGECQDLSGAVRQDLYSCVFRFTWICAHGHTFDSVNLNQQTCRQSLFCPRLGAKLQHKATVFGSALLTCWNRSFFINIKMVSKKQKKNGQSRYCPVCCKTLSSIPGFYLLNTRSKTHVWPMLSTGFSNLLPEWGTQHHTGWESPQ